MRLRVLTYNIHKGIGGVDRRYRLGRIVEAIAHCEPDVVLLQEVDDGVPRSRRHRQVDLLADALGLPYRAYQRNVVLRQGYYGNAILSRFPLQDVSSLDLTVPMKKRRQALVAHCRVRAGNHVRTILLVNVHLGLAGFERRLQVRRLLESEVLRRAHRHTPVIAGGDFNDGRGRLRKRLMEPAGFRPVGRRMRTFPAVMPVRTLDWIYYRGELRLDHAFASRTAKAKQASDHLPVVADFLL